MTRIVIHAPAIELGVFKEQWQALTAELEKADYEVTYPLRTRSEGV